MIFPALILVRDFFVFFCFTSSVPLKGEAGVGFLLLPPKPS